MLDAQAITTVLELSEVLCVLSEQDEGSRARKVKEILNKYVGLNFVDYCFQDHCRTDGSIVREWGESKAVANMELKQELGMGGGCPYLQSSAYFTKFIHESKNTDALRLSRFPALLVYVAGLYIGVAGAAFLGLPVVEPMTPMMPLYYLTQNERLLLATARMLSALKTALVDLDKYYNGLAQGQKTSPSTQQLTFPYVDCVYIGEGEARLRYRSKLGGGFNVFQEVRSRGRMTSSSSLRGGTRGSAMRSVTTVGSHRNCLHGSGFRAAGMSLSWNGCKTTRHCTHSPESASGDQPLR